MFNDNGDPFSSYDIIAWDWSGSEWNFRVIGSSTGPPVQLDINKTKIRWHGEDNQVRDMVPHQGTALWAAWSLGMLWTQLTKSRRGIPGTRPTRLYPALPGQPPRQYPDGWLLLVYKTRGSALGVSSENRCTEIIAHSTREHPFT